MRSNDKQDVPVSKDEVYYLYTDIENIASATDCTGLIPTPPVNKDEAEAYTELYSIPRPSIEKEGQESGARE